MRAFLPVCVLILFFFVQTTGQACQDIVPTCNKAKAYCQSPSLVNTLRINCPRSCGQFDKYRLHYFDVRFRAEPIRLAFTYRKIPFEDIRLTNAQWDARKAYYPDQELPLLEVNGQKLSQSMAIYRYIGKKLDLAGTSDLETAHLDYAAELWRTFVDRTEHYKRVANGDVPGDENAVYTAEYAPALAKYAPKMEALLAQSRSGFFGKQLSWVDFFVAGTVQTFKIIDMVGMQAYPQLLAHNQKIYALPQLRAYFRQHPPTGAI
ncbi:Glutathione S-transferase 1 [Aphelenchoides fujianensis]|nr:Glutathione S-transferase 1 [Aphelenchoides fujianensis]